MIFLYGPPGSGKSTLGPLLAASLDIPFTDLDARIEAAAGQSIPQIFAAQGEAAFRAWERRLLLEILPGAPDQVIALGGGCLLDDDLRRRVDARGPVICLGAAPEILLERLLQAQTARPLLQGDPAERLALLLERRGAHYASFSLRSDSGALPPEALVYEAQIACGRFRVHGMGAPYDVIVRPGGLSAPVDLPGERSLDGVPYDEIPRPGGLSALGDLLHARGLGGPLALVSDENVARCHLDGVQAGLQAAGYTVLPVILPPGEAHKTLATVSRLWSAFLHAGLDRGSTVLALGGGVVGDLAGFAAAAYLRGVRWATLPTSLLAMVDASLGGKTGADLPEGKNLVGAFHPPSLVLADPLVLHSLPEEELRSGLAEVVKHGIISDPALFALCSPGWDAARQNLDAIVRRAIAVKVQVICADPYERGYRAALNLGHSLGHAIEQVSGFRVRHGEGVAIGTAAAARLGERLGLSKPGLAEEICTVLAGLGLPTTLPPGLDAAALEQAMRLDKKRQDGVVKFVIPQKVGQVQTGVAVPDLAGFLKMEQRL